MKYLVEEFAFRALIRDRHTAGILAALLLVAAATISMRTANQTNTFTERFIAFAVNMDAWAPTLPGTVEIAITGWSTDAERDTLTALLFDRGPAALLDALRDARKVGFIRMPNSVGYDLHFAREVPGEDGGRRIILVTDRPISLWETANQARSIEYPFTLIELRLNRDGEGEGKMSIATRITGNKAFNLIELEDYGTQPVRLISVRRVRTPTS